MLAAQPREPSELVGDVERLLDDIEALADPAARTLATELVQALLELYGAGLERIIDAIAQCDDGSLAQALAGDELVAHLLLLHGLHPVALADRVEQALTEVRPYLESHGGNVEVLGIEGGALRVRLDGSCSGCPSSRVTLKLAIENAIRKAAPEIEEVVADEAGAPSGLLQIEPSPALNGTPPSTEWTMVGGLPELSGAGHVVKRVGGRLVLFLSLDGRFYGYGPNCPACEQALDTGRLRGVELECPGCGNHYDVVRAGRCVDSPDVYLEPVPLLVGQDGLVKVALG